jgi:hypothetical protein
VNITDIVTVMVQIADQVASTPNFGVPLLLSHIPVAASPAAFGVRSYTADSAGLTSLATDIGAGYATTWAYLAAQRLCAQSPHCATFAVAARQHVAGSRFRVDVSGSLAENDVTTCTITLDGVALTQASSTADATPTAAECVTDLLDDIALLEGVTGVVDEDDDGAFYLDVDAAASRMAVVVATSGSAVITATDVSVLQDLSLTVAAPTIGTKYGVYVSIGGAATTSCEYVAESGDVEADVLDAHYTLLVAAGCTVTKVGSPTESLRITSTTTNGRVYFAGAGRTSNVYITDNSPDVGIGGDLDTALASGVDWFGILADNNGAAEIAQGAVWAEANERLFCAQPTDDACWDPASTTDIAYVADAAGYNFTALYPTRSTLSMANVAQMGKMFAYNPGYATWHAKSLTGVTADVFSGTASGAIKTKHCIEYGTLKQIDMTVNGWAVSGRFIDITHGNAWMVSELQRAGVMVQANNVKVPNNATGRSLIKSALMAVMRLAESPAYGFVDPGSTVVNVPVVGDSTDTSANRILRLLAGTTITCLLQGAIHSFTLVVNESV